MSEFKNAQVTLKGNVLLAKALTGEPLTFTRIVMGDGYATKPIMEIESLVNVKKELPITKLRRKENVAVIGGILKLGEIEPFYWRELGLYAKGQDDVEVLYMYGNAADLASYISSSGLNEKLIDINVVIGNASNVSAAIDSSLVFLTQQDLVDHNNDEDAHEALKVWVLSLFNGGDWAKYTQAEDIQNRIGKNTDDGAKNTLFGFLSTIKSKLDATISSRAPANTALSNGTWTNARATAIDAINTNAARLTAARATIIDNIGATGNTGGSATAGTVMAKLNAILTWFTGTWTAARAAKIDTINNSIGATGNTGGSTTAGTAMAKLNAVLTKADAILSKAGQGDYAGKRFRMEFVSTYSNYSFQDAKGGLAVILPTMYTTLSTWTLEVDGVVIFRDKSYYRVFSMGYTNSQTEDEITFAPLIIPFNSNFKISSDKPNDVTIRYYLNK